LFEKKTQIPKKSIYFLGAAYGTAKAGVGISAMGVLKPDLVMRNM